MFSDDRYPPDFALSSAGGVEQQQQLLVPGRIPAGQSSAAHLADHMERGGAKIEETLSRLNCKYQVLFFIAALAVLVASLLSIGASLLRLDFPTFIASFFLLAFGIVMAILDFPGNPRWAARYRYLVRKYVRFLTRLTGKSLWFLYLGCVVTASLWPRRGGAHGFLVFFSIFVSVFIFFVATVGLFIACRKTMRLEKLRKALQVSFRENSGDVYRKFAITDPAHGMQFEEFSRLAQETTHGHLVFDVADLSVIFSALDEHQKSAIDEREFSEWMCGGTTYL